MVPVYNVISNEYSNTHGATRRRLGITSPEASHRLSLLVDEGLAIANKTAKGKPDGTYQLSS